MSDALALTAERLDERAQELDRRDASLKSLLLQNEARDRKLDVLSRDIDARDLVCYRLRRELDEREDAIAPRESALDAKEAELAGRRLVVEEQLSQLSEASERLNTRSIELDTQANDLARREAALKLKTDAVGVSLESDPVVTVTDGALPSSGDPSNGTAPIDPGVGHFGPSPEPDLPSPSKAPPPLPDSEGVPALAGVSLTSLGDAPATLVDNVPPVPPGDEPITATDLEPPHSDTEPSPPPEGPPELPPPPKLAPHWMPGG